MKVRDVILGLVMIWIVVYVIKDVAVKVDKMMGMSVIRALKVTSAEEVRILKVTSAEEVRMPDVSENTWRWCFMVAEAIVC
ncbi:hypothetical protein Tco_1451112 [Tanacetum coccineum]